MLVQVTCNVEVSLIMEVNVANTDPDTINKAVANELANTGISAHNDNIVECSLLGLVPTNQMFVNQI